MRKLIALALTALMLLSLCACGASQEKMDALLLELEAAQAALEEYEYDLTAPEHIQSAEDFRWNGKTEAWFLLPSEVSPEMLLVSSAIGSMCQANGWTYERKELGPETGTALSLLKAAIAAGDVGAIVYTSLSEYLADFVQTAADEGIIVLCLDPDSPAPVAGSIDIPYAQMGLEAINTLAAWCERAGYVPAEGEQLPVAINIYGTGDPQHELAAAMLSAIDASETLFKCRLGTVPETDSGDIFAEAYLWARQIMSGVPELRLFCCDTPEAAYGVCYFLEQYAADNELDLAEFCVIWVGEDADSETYLTVALEDDSYTAARAYVTCGDDGWTTGSRLGYELLGIAYGVALPTNLETTYVTLCENGVVQPETFGGWKWGQNALSGVTVYSTFAETEDRVFLRLEMPLSDIIDLNVNPDMTTEEAGEGE